MPFQAYLFSRAAVKSTQTISFLSVSNGKFLLIMLKILSLRRGKRKRHDAFYMLKSAMFVTVRECIPGRRTRPQASLHGREQRTSKLMRKPH